MTCAGYLTAATAARLTAARPGPLSYAERERLLLGVQKLIARLVNDSGIPARDRDDVIQDATLQLWRALEERYDPARSAITTFARRVVLGAIANHRRDRATRGRPPAQMERPESVEAPPGGPDPDADDDRPSSDTLAAVADLAGLTDGLTGSQRELFRLVVAERLTAPQIAERLSRKLSIVEIGIRGMVRRLIEGGRLPAELVERFAEWKAADAINPARRVRCRPGREWRPRGSRKAADDPKPGHGVGG